MDTFLTRLAARTLGLITGVQPLLPTLFAPNAEQIGEFAYESPLSLTVREDSFPMSIPNAYHSLDSIASATANPILPSLEQLAVTPHASGMESLGAPTAFVSQPSYLLPDTLFTSPIRESAPLSPFLNIFQQLKLHEASALVSLGMPSTPSISPVQVPTPSFTGAEVNGLEIPRSRQSTTFDPSSKSATEIGITNASKSPLQQVELGASASVAIPLATPLAQATHFSPLLEIISGSQQQPIDSVGHSVGALWRRQHGTIASLQPRLDKGFSGAIAPSHEIPLRIVQDLQPALRVPQPSPLTKTVANLDSLGSAIKTRERVSLPATQAPGRSSILSPQTFSSLSLSPKMVRVQDEQSMGLNAVQPVAQSLDSSDRKLFLAKPPAIAPNLSTLKIDSNSRTSSIVPNSVTPRVDSNWGTLNISPNSTISKIDPNLGIPSITPNSRSNIVSNSGISSISPIRTPSITPISETSNIVQRAAQSQLPTPPVNPLIPTVSTAPVSFLAASGEESGGKVVSRSHPQPSTATTVTDPSDIAISTHHSQVELATGRGMRQFFHSFGSTLNLRPSVSSSQPLALYSQSSDLPTLSVRSSPIAAELTSQTTSHIASNSVAETVAVPPLMTHTRSQPATLERISVRFLKRSVPCSVAQPSRSPDPHSLMLTEQSRQDPLPPHLFSEQTEGSRAGMLPVTPLKVILPAASVTRPETDWATLETKQQQKKGSQRPSRQLAQQSLPSSDSSALSSSSSTVEIKIGRIEVRRTNPPTPSLARTPAKPKGPTLSLEDYLKQRDGRTQ